MFLSLQFSSVQFSLSVVSDSLWPHESQHARPPCPSPFPGVHSDSCPSSPWCHPAIPLKMLKTISILTVKFFDDIQLLENLRVIIFNVEVLFKLQNKELILKIEFKHNKIWSTNSSDFVLFCFVFLGISQTAFHSHWYVCMCLQIKPELELTLNKKGSLKQEQQWLPIGFPRYIC